MTVAAAFRFSKRIFRSTGFFLTANSSQSNTGKVRRTLQIVAVLWTYFLKPVLLPWRPRQTGPVRVHRALETLGGTWVKLGQALALRFDLLPNEYCYELFKLLNDVKPFPYGSVAAIVQQEFGSPPEILFQSFEREPFAAASIGQVHRAELPSGEQVAVKVQRPNIRQTIRTDVEIMYLFGGLVDRLRFAGATRLTDIIDEFSRMLAAELDYLVEARQAERLRENAGNDRFEKNARVFWKFTTSRVLTTEFIAGIPLIDIMYALGSGNQEYLQDLQRRGYDLHVIVQHIDWNMLNQICVHGYFHADLHPANLLVLPGNAIAYVDFGIVGTLPTAVRESLARYTSSLFCGDVEGAVTELLRWARPSAQTDLDAIRADLFQIIDDYLLSLQMPQSGAAKRGASVFGVAVLKAIHNHSLVLSPAVVPFFKTLVTADTLRYELAPDYDLQSLANRFFKRLRSMEMRRWANPRVMAGLLLEGSSRLRQLLARLDSPERLQNADSTGLDRGIRVALLLALASLALCGFLLFRQRTDAVGSIRSMSPMEWLALVPILILLCVIWRLTSSPRPPRRRNPINRLL